MAQTHGCMKRTMPTTCWDIIQRKRKNYKKKNSEKQLVKKKKFQKFLFRICYVYNMILEMYKTDRIGDVVVDLLRVCFCDIVKTVVGSVSTWWSYSCTLECKQKE